MSIIVPAGVKEVKWSPVKKQDSMTKTASTDTEGQEEPQDDKDALFEAAQKVIADRAAKEAQAAKDEEVVEAEEKTQVKKAEEDKESCGDVTAEDEGEDEAPCDEAPCDDAADEAGEVGEVEDIGEEPASDPAATIQEAVAELSEKAEAADAAAEVVEEAVETISEVVEEVKATLSGGEDVENVMEEGPEEEAVIEVVDEIPGEPVPEEADMIVEGDEILASSTENMVKLSKLSPENRSKLDSYWKSFYGEAADWVDLLTKDYEK